MYQSHLRRSGDNFQFSQLMLLLASGEQRLGMLLNTLQRIAPPPTTTKYPAPKVNSAEVEKPSTEVEKPSVWATVRTPCKDKMNGRNVIRQLTSALLQSGKWFIWVGRETGWMGGSKLNRDGRGVPERSAVPPPPFWAPQFGGLRKRKDDCVFCVSRWDHKEMMILIPCGPVTEDQMRWWMS